jgi:ATP-dependent helicase YprA (DUF1998 family)/very-short-patch-repair endonuclease
MNVFDLRRQLTEEYAAYTRSFITIRDPQLQEAVDRDLAAGLLWPEPIIQLNPAFAMGSSVDELVAEGVLHQECRWIFRTHKDLSPQGRLLRLYRHQSDAVRLAATGASYVLTTGTGSGKSLAYLIPIVDRVLREGPGKGIRAIVVYPMNALANSQAGELEKFLKLGYPDNRGPVTFRRYTGQEGDQERNEIIGTPPDVLLTNYVMLELILTRPLERRLIQAAQNLRFLVLDELHTYRGRQGSDVALLVRRVREACNAGALQCVGTSATLAGAEDADDRRAEVARVATQLFGAEVAPASVMGETLRRATGPCDPADPAFVAALRTRVSDPRRRPTADYAAFVDDPLARWVESTFGLEREEGSGELVRARPKPVRGAYGAAAVLSNQIGESEERCAAAIEETLLAGHAIAQPETGFPVFAFRVHQFLSRGETVWATPESEDHRVITTHVQQFVPGERSRRFLPLAFCRECGQEYYTVRAVPGKDEGLTFEPRELLDTSDEEQSTNGFLYISTDAPWPEDPREIIDRLPDEWLEERGEATVVRRDCRDRLPRPVRVDPSGREAADGARFHFVPAPFRFCLRCGVSYVSRERKDFGKLNTLGSGGRASATTILTSAVIRTLRHDPTLEDRARKLLSFTDNRQDASLQAGHFNDFIQVGVLRSGLYRAAAVAGDTGLRHDELTQQVVQALSLPLDLYARDPTVRFAAREETERALRDVIGYRLYRDLERGWRVTAPNLEQCGLLEIGYVSLEELCAAEDLWADRHPALAGATADERRLAAKALLDHMRRALAIRVDYLTRPFQDQMRLRSNQHLILPWAIDEEEVLEYAGVVYPHGRPRAAAEARGNVYLSARGEAGRFLRRQTTFRSYAQRLTLDDTDVIIRDLLEALRIGGLVGTATPPGADGAAGYQVMAAGMRWIARDGTRPLHDPIRVATLPAEGLRTNRYFVEFYKGVAADGKGLEAREHTAQVPADQREEREHRFREGRLPVLFCSPTMELGVDIAELNVVNLRNVPPTPANYAQRSGRAGRSGQPALVFTYCAAGSSHDQYFFRRPEQMVGGQVRPPQLDLTNEDLIRAHVHAVWLAECGADLRASLADILDVDGVPPSLAVRDALRAQMERRDARAAARARCERILASIPGLSEADWFHPAWLDGVLDGVLLAFDRACERWRGLYQAAFRTRDAQDRIVVDASRSPMDREKAKRLRAEAETQLELLRVDPASGRTFQSDFYSYRYFASEGFLPGYSFPRLPLSAFIPGRRGAVGRDEFLSRPRFVAIAEFGPRSIVYHEGSRYVINQVMLPAERSGDNRLLTHSVKQCARCGYMHPLADGPGPDLCERCGAALGAPIERLFRLQNVSTRRRDRINSDEEERLRQGFEIRTGIRFAEGGGAPRVRTATVAVDGAAVADLAYSGAATIWRINLGWARRARKEQYGFVLDTERGYWAKSAQTTDDPDDPVSHSTERVIPYVEDRRNALLLQVRDIPDEEAMASLGAALKRAVQLIYQLEEQELAVEFLPDSGHRRLILFYESAEGGAGVLRRLVTDPNAVAQVAVRALEVCHFDPETGDDLGRARGARADCEAACYDCLMSYGNQPDHRLLDRQLIKDLLLLWTRSRVEASPGPLPRKQHLERLLRQCQTETERRFLRFLEHDGYALPSRAQVVIERCAARPDFVYDAEQAVVFVDGPVHEYPDVAARDGQATRRLEDAGYTVIRFSEDADTWPAIAAGWPSVFRRGS